MNSSLQGAEKIQGAKEGSLPEQYKTEGRLLIRKKDLTAEKPKGRFLTKEGSSLEWYKPKVGLWAG